MTTLLVSNLFIASTPYMDISTISEINKEIQNIITACFQTTTFVKTFEVWIAIK